MLVLFLTIAVVVLDQVTKQAIITQFHVGESLTVIPGFFSLTYVTNSGAAWGMLAGQTLGLTSFSVVVLALLLVFRRRLFADVLSHRLAMGLICGGIVGNLLDRLRHFGRVIDFLDVYIGPRHWPTFNVADSAICIGVAIYILTTLRAPPDAADVPQAKAEAEADAAPAS